MPNVPPIQPQHLTATLYMNTNVMGDIGDPQLYDLVQIKNISAVTIGFLYRTIKISSLTAEVKKSVNALIPMDPNNDKRTPQAKCFYKEPKYIADACSKDLKGTL